ncbi:MAG: T9SS type A sorting domain-containing protein [Flavobacteriales bacterium]|nr:T9SS type A sorting domain-containing protein [Flavobacteriales bacterium]
MKHLFTLCFFCSLHFMLFAQGSITSITVSPANPNESDDISIYVNVQLPNSGCDVQTQAHGLQGNTIGASALHCMGLLTAICNTTDTFQIGQLPAGNYTFDFTLSSGSGSPNCSPGIVPDDNDQLQFTVSTAVGIENVKTEKLTVFPNPTTDFLSVGHGNSPCRIISMDGQEVGNQIIPNDGRIDVQNLPSGLYIFELKLKGTVGRAVFGVSR